jgi:hypothetical protein
MKSCTRCGSRTDELTVKKVLFAPLGKGQRVIRSRVVDWLCDECRQTDPAWREPMYASITGRTQ